MHHFVGTYKENQLMNNMSPYGSIIMYAISEPSMTNKRYGGVIGQSHRNPEDACLSISLHVN